MKKILAQATTAVLLIPVSCITLVLMPLVWMLLGIVAGVGMIINMWKAAFTEEKNEGSAIL